MRWMVGVVLALLGLGGPTALAQESKPLSRPVEPSARTLHAAETRLSAALKERKAEKRIEEAREILKLTAPLTSSIPDDVTLWRVRGAAAVELESWREGREAGTHLKRLLPSKGGDGSARRVLDLVSGRGWLGADLQKVELAARARENAASRERLRSWGTPAKGCKIDPQTGLPREVLHSQTGIVLVLVPAGEFTCGASANDTSAFPSELPRHKVTISRSFYLGKFEVTNEQFRRFDKNHLSPDLEGLRFDAADHPAVTVSWARARAFCDQMGLRLPTEAEWEYAARAGIATRFPWGDDPEGGLGWANVLNDGHKLKADAKKTGVRWEDGYVGAAPVGKFRANAFELHDMVGNAWEWVEDWFDAEAYAARKGGAVDPSNLDVKTAEDEGELDFGNGLVYRAPFRILRGGSFSSEPPELRISFRAWIAAEHALNDTGFRVAKTP